jgi:hypothetical protein
LSTAHLDLLKAVHCRGRVGPSVSVRFDLDVTEVNVVVLGVLGENPSHADEHVVVCSNNQRDEKGCARDDYDVPKSLFICS